MTVLLDASPPEWASPTPRQILHRPMPELGAGDRWLLRALTLLGRSQVHINGGLEHVAPANDPFILVLNHCTRREALLVPALLMLHRSGRRIHFMADWNFRLIPGIGMLYRRAETITVTRKPARPAVLNALKPLYREPATVVERARARLLAGGSVGIFPEARINRDPGRLLRGRTGAAYLSLETGFAIVPAGIRVREAGSPQAAALEVEIGAPMRPPRPGSQSKTAELRAWHAAVMTEIARLSGKAWVYAGGEPRCSLIPVSARAA